MLAASAIPSGQERQVAAQITAGRKLLRPLVRLLSQRFRREAAEFAARVNAELLHRPPQVVVDRAR